MSEKSRYVSDSLVVDWPGRRIDLDIDYCTLAPVFPEKAAGLIGKMLLIVTFLLQISAYTLYAQEPPEAQAPPPDSLDKWYQQAMDLRARGREIPSEKDSLNREALARFIQYCEAPGHTSHPIAYKAYFYRGRLHNAFGQRTQAQACFQQVTFLFPPEGSKKLLAQNYRYLGISFTRSGDYNRAVTYLQKGKTLSEETDYGYNLGMTLMELGIASFWQKNYRKAITCYHQALGINDRLMEQNKGPILKNLADAYAALSEMDLTYLDSARSYYLQTLDLFDNPSYLAQTLVSLSLVTSDPVQAKSHLDEALSYIRQAYPDMQRREVGKIYIARGRFFLENQQYESALSAFQEALRAVLGKAVPENIFAPPSPQTYYTENVIMEGLEGKATAFSSLYQTTQDSSYLHRALTCHRNILAIEDLLRKGYLFEDAKFSLTREGYNRRVEAIKIAHQLYQKTQDPAFLDEAYFFAERSNATLLLDALQSARASVSTAIPPQLNDQYRMTQQRIQALEQEQFVVSQREEERQDKLPEIETALQIQREKLDSISQEISRQYPVFSRLRKEMPVLSARDFQRQLDDQTLVLYYVWGIDHLYCLGIKNGITLLKNIPTEKSWADEIMKFQMGLSHPEGFSQGGENPIKAFSEQAHLWYRRLLLPVLEEMDTTGVRDLVVIPDGSLAFLPFDALLTQSKPNAHNFRELPYVLNRFSVRTAFSASSLFFEAPVPAHAIPTLSFAGFAPIYDPAQPTTALRGLEQFNFSPLQYNRKEVADLASLAGGKAMIGPEASEENFTKIGPKANLLHLSLHGWVDPDFPNASGLAFQAPSDTSSLPITDGNDGILYLHELYGMQIPAELVVLSACQTAAGQYFQGEGVLSIARGFRHTGARNLISSLWQASDGATEYFMQLFYQHLKEGIPKAEALRKAKQDYLSTMDQTHPFFWSTFVLVGDNEPVQFEILGHNFVNTYILLIVVFSIVGVLVVKTLFENKKK